MNNDERGVRLTTNLFKLNESVSFVLFIYTFLPALIVNRCEFSLFLSRRHLNEQINMAVDGVMLLNRNCMVALFDV